MRSKIDVRFAVLAILFAAMVLAAPPIPPPSTDVPLAAKPGKETAVFAGGCFWGVQSVFQRVKGVITPPQAIQAERRPRLLTGRWSPRRPGHAESVEVVYDPSRITYGQLLRIYFSVAHDPTQLNRQGPDVGTSYRSAIFYTNDEQRRLAKAYIAQLDARRSFQSQS